MSERVDLRPVAGASHEWIVGWHRSIVAHAKNLAPETRGLLRDPTDVAAGGHEERSIAAKCDASAQPAGALISVGNQNIAHLGENAVFQPSTRDAWGAFVILDRLVVRE